jgi:hypothetical protein
MLVEEIERLNIDLWHARADRLQALPVPHPVEQHQGSARADPGQRALPPPLPAF